MKVCSVCGLEKSLTDFSWRNKSKGTLQSRCKSCQRSMDNNNYAKSSIRRDKIRISGSLWKKSFRDWFHDLKKDKCCVKCGDERIYVLEFHHIDPSTKLFNVSNPTTQSKIKIKDEVEKCVILCANCHREFHHLERTLNTTLQNYIED